MAAAIGGQHMDRYPLWNVYNETNINEFGRYDELKKTVDKAKAKEYFEKTECIKLIPPKVNVKVDNLLREFIISGGFDIPMPTEYK
jgi:type I restriction enzyme, R subunit